MEASTKGGLISSFTKPQNDLFGESLIYRTLYQNSSLSRLKETRATQHPKQIVGAWNYS